MQNLIKLTTGNALKLFALVFWYLSIAFVVQFIAVKVGSDWAQSVIRSGEYRWDYEAMYAAVNLVWGIFCWKAAKNPIQHKLFTQFTITANIFHAIVMATIGAFRPGEFNHLLIDSLVLFVPAVLLAFTMRKKLLQFE